MSLICTRTGSLARRYLFLDLTTSDVIQTMKMEALVLPLHIHNVNHQTLGSLLLLLQKNQNLPWLCMSKLRPCLLSPSCITQGIYWVDHPWMKPKFPEPGASLGLPSLVDSTGHFKSPGLWEKIHTQCRKEGSLKSELEL